MISRIDYVTASKEQVVARRLGSSTWWQRKESQSSADTNSGFQEKLHGVLSTGIHRRLLGKESARIGNYVE
ncbi:MAG TPA: hypothetical protein VEJ17_00155 [Candidatus Nitrosotalea sp.]|nr:hypothetical protein [Candidatus Nitrosotalea sp.]